MELVKGYDRKDGSKVRLLVDEGARSPREDACYGFGNLLTWESFHDSPDENPYSDLEELLTELLVERVGLKGIVKGLVGLVYADCEDAEKAFGDLGNQLTLKGLELFLDCCVDAYSQWVNGEVYVLEVESPDGDVESMGGIYVEPSDEETVLRYSKIIMPLQDAA